MSSLTCTVSTARWSATTVDASTNGRSWTVGVPRRDPATQQLQLVGFRGVADGHPEHEAVELGLGERVGPLRLDRILGGQNKERSFQDVADPVRGDLPLLHGLQYRGLGLGRGPVDLVAQHQVGEDRPRAGSASHPCRRERRSPVRSAGIRSGVNCTRLNRSWSTWAKLRAISVLATPGTSSMST